jgi:putative PIN family toxin of toxin-antitoxin system
MKAVFDTNIFISAFVIPWSQGEQAFLLAQQKRFELYTSVAILTETASKLREKFNQTEEDVKQSLKIISRAAEVLKPTVKLNVLKDEPDNRILECALESRADIIVTGDRHLLKIRKFRSISIIRLADLLRMFPDPAEE